MAARGDPPAGEGQGASRGARRGPLPRLHRRPTGVTLAFRQVLAGSREYSGHLVSSQFLETIEKVEPLKAVGHFKGPTLIIHPEKDEYLPVSHAEDYFQAAGAASKEQVIVRGADHTFTSVAWEREVIERTVDWFRKHLAPAAKIGRASCR